MVIFNETWHNWHNIVRCVYFDWKWAAYYFSLWEFSVSIFISFWTVVYCLLWPSNVFYLLFCLLFLLSLLICIISDVIAVQGLRRQDSERNKVWHFCPGAFIFSNNSSGDKERKQERKSHNSTSRRFMELQKILFFFFLVEDFFS